MSEIRKVSTTITVIRDGEEIELSADGTFELVTQALQDTPHWTLQEWGVTPNISLTDEEKGWLFDKLYEENYEYS